MTLEAVSSQACTGSFARDLTVLLLKSTTALESYQLVAELQKCCPCMFVGVWVPAGIFLVPAANLGIYPLPRQIDVNGNSAHADMFEFILHPAKKQLLLAYAFAFWKPLGLHALYCLL